MQENSICLFREYAARIWRWMPELARITKPGGRVITINPVSWPDHEAPHVRHAVPGRSLQNQPTIRKVFSPVFARFGGRVEKSFDNISIARKPQP